jgi:hypothetical protein
MEYPFHVRPHELNAKKVFCVDWALFFAWCVQVFAVKGGFRTTPSITSFSLRMSFGRLLFAIKFCDCFLSL